MSIKRVDDVYPPGYWMDASILTLPSILLSPAPYGKSLTLDKSIQETGGPVQAFATNGPVGIIHAAGDVYSDPGMHNVVGALFDAGHGDHFVASNSPLPTNDFLYHNTGVGRFDAPAPSVTPAPTPAASNAAAPLGTAASGMVTAAKAGADIIRRTVTDTAAGAATKIQSAALQSTIAFIIANQTTGQQTLTTGDFYIGPLTGINRQMVLVTPDKLNIMAATPNVFIHSGSGNDAIDVSSAGGNNILDGSTGSNFLTGGSGNDTFYLDNRGPTADVFSTVVGFHRGDNASVFGVSLNNFTLTSLDNQGAAGYRGLDFQFTAAGKPTASLVLTGYTAADLTNGRLTVSYGVTNDAPGAPGSVYLNIHGN